MPSCCVLLPRADQSRVTTLAVETTGPLINQSMCNQNPCCGKRRRKHRKHRR